MALKFHLNLPTRPKVTALLSGDQQTDRHFESPIPVGGLGNTNPCKISIISITTITNFVLEG